LTTERRSLIKIGFKWLTGRRKALGALLLVNFL